jgi:protein tyrosine phosphatase (PTP) superfamily phosphohydrolase (DUF442 family)
MKPIQYREIGSRPEMEERDIPEPEQCAQLCEHAGLA